MRPATDFGIQLDSTADQTDKVQSALDAAAGDGFDLLLPADTIVCEGPLNWKCHTHAIRGTQKSILDFSNATFDGPAITLDGSRLPGQSGPVVLPSGMHGVILKGPTDANTTVDGIRYQGDPIGTGTSVYGVTINHVAVQGFRHQEVYGNRAWLIHHHDYNASKWVDSAIYWIGTMTCGENIRYAGGSFANGAKVVNVPGHANINMSFAGTSFDYNTGSVLIASSGRYTLESCHIEYSRAADGSFPVTFDLTSDNAVYPAPTLTLHGGLLLITKGTQNALPGEDLTVVRTTTSGNCGPIVVTSDGMSVRNRLLGDPVLTFHRETHMAVDTQWNAKYPRVSFTGNLDYNGQDTLTRLGHWASILDDGDFAATTTWPTSWSFSDGPSVGWCALDSSVTRDTTEKPDGMTASAKLTFANGAPGGQLLMQPLAVIQRTTLHAGLRIKTSGWATGSVCGIYALFYDAAGNQIAGAQGFMNLTLGANDEWTWHGGWLMVPNSAVVATFYPRLNGSTGTMWISDVTVSAL